MRRKPTLGDMLRLSRGEAGYGQRAFADLVGISPAYLSRLENGRIDCIPSEKALKLIAKKLSLDADELLCLAGRIPSDIEKYIVRNPRVLKRLRREVERAQ